LNTLAQRGGLSQLDIAKWSGRKDVRQNRAYDHMSGDEILALVQKSVANDEELFGSIVAFRPNEPVSREEIARMLVPTAHQTDVGFCVHDYSVLPCQLHRDCINCPEHVCIKGDAAKAERLRKRLDVDRILLAKAEEEAGLGTVGANRWLDHHRLTVTRLEQLVAILEDPSVPDGTVIRLPMPPGHSFLLPPEPPLGATAPPRKLSSPPEAPSLDDLRSVLAEME
jgi:hypothetical protein